MVAVIKPELQDAYYYDVSETKEDITAYFQIPQSLNVESFVIEMSEDKSYIKIDIGQEIPVLNGEFFGPVTGFEKTVQGNIILLKFQKTTPGLWPVLIKSGKAPNYMDLDPKSAFMIFDFLMSTNAPTTESLGMAMLHVAAQQGFSAAMVIEAGMMLRDETMTGEALAILQKVATLYNHSGAYFILGRLYNPHDPFQFADKNSAKAVEYFEKGISLDKQPVPMRMLIDLYTSGDGVEKDLVRAEELRLIAEDIESRMPKHHCGCGCEDHEPEPAHDGCGCGHDHGHEHAHEHAHEHSHAHEHDGCGCGHDHGHEHAHEHEHSHEHVHEGCECEHNHEEGHCHKKDGECCGRCH